MKNSIMIISVLIFGIFCAVVVNADNIIIIQMDDTQSGWNEDASNATATAFNDNGTYLTAEVIPVNLNNGTTFKDLVKNYSQMSYIEIAMGQYDHDTTQSSLTYAQTVSDLNAGNFEFNTIGVTVPTSFIPAFDYGDNDTFDALNDTNYTVILDYSIAPDLRNGLWEKPLTLHNGTEITTNTGNGLIVADAALKTNVDNQIASKSYASLAIHMQDFAGPNYAKIDNVISNLSWLKGQGYTFMTARQYYNYINGGVSVDNAYVNETSVLINQLIKLNVTVTSLNYLIDTVLATFIYPNSTEINVTMSNANISDTLNPGDKESGTTSFMVQATGGSGGTTCVNETEEFGTFLPDGNWSTGGDASWVQNNSGLFVYNLPSSAMSGRLNSDTGNYNETWIRVNKTFCTDPPGGVDFYWKVNSEANFDYLGFCGTNLTCCVSATCGAGVNAGGYESRITSNTNWTQYIGNRTSYTGVTQLHWEYGVDDYTAGGDSAGWLDTINFYNVQQTTTGTPVDTTDNITSYTTYSDVESGTLTTITGVNISITVSVYNNSGSVYDSGNTNPDLELEAYNGSDWISINNYSVTTTQSYSLTTTDATILSSWITPTNRDVRLRGLNMDFNTTGYYDEINISEVFVIIDGVNSSSEYVYEWTDTANSGTYNVTHIIANDTGGGYNDTVYGGLSFVVNSTNNVPTIVGFNLTTPISPTESVNTTITVNFTLNDGDGTGNINNNRQMLMINFSSGESRSNNSCLSADTGNSREYSCDIDMDYYLPGGTWSVNATGCDNSDACAESVNETFTYSSLTSISTSPTEMGFPSSKPGDTNVKAGNSINITNTGNVNSSTIDVMGFDLWGSRDSSVVLQVINFTAKITDDCGGNALSNNSYVTITNAANYAFPSTILEELFFCIDTTPNLVGQDYNTTTNDKWVVRIT